MSGKPTQFAQREALAAQQQVRSAKRSGHVALLLMGTVAVGSGAYALMPAENCDPNRPGQAASYAPGQTNECAQRRSSSSGSSHGYSGSGSSSRNSLYDGTSTSGPSGGAAADASHVTRGGFGSFAHAFTSHFSGGG